MMNRFLRLVPSSLRAAAVAASVVALATGCKVTSDDVEYWKGTVKGPGKMVAVLLTDRYPMDLRIRAALALIEMERTDVQGLEELQRALQRLPAGTRAELIDGMVPGLEGLMRADDAAAGGATGAVPERQIRAKDAAYVLIAHGSPGARDRLVRAVMGWYTVDFSERSLSGAYSSEQVVRSLGAPAATMLVDALSAEMPSEALVKIAELVGQLADATGKERAGAQLVRIEQEMEGEEFLNKLKERIREQLRRQNAGQAIDENRVGIAARLTREDVILRGALPAMKHLASVPAVAARLLAMAEVASTDDAGHERRRMALVALTGQAKEASLQALLALALAQTNPPIVRDAAFDLIGDIGSQAAIAPMWPLVQNAEEQRLRWRAGELVLHLGQAGIVSEFLSKLPTGSTKYEPEELEGYATRMSQMTPPPTGMRSNLDSPSWWIRVIALHFLARRGTEADLGPMRFLTRDSTQATGDHWPRDAKTVGKVAEAAIAALQERLAQPAAAAPAPTPGAAPAAGAAAPAAAGAP